MKKINIERNIVIRNINAKLSGPKIRQEVWTKHANSSNYEDLEKSEFNNVKSKATLYEMKCYTSWCMNPITPFNFHIGFIMPLNIRTSENIDKDNLIPICRSCSNGMNNKIRFREWDKKFVNTLPKELYNPRIIKSNKAPEIKSPEGHISKVQMYKIPEMISLSKSPEAPKIPTLEIKPPKVEEIKPPKVEEIKPQEHKPPKVEEIKDFIPKMPIIPDLILESGTSDSPFKSTKRASLTSRIFRF